MGERVVIIGGGPAGAECAAALRMSGFEGPVTLLSADAHIPYNLPPLSKDYLKGAATLDEILIRPASSYARHGIDIRLGVRATAIDRSERCVRLSDDSSVGYDKLVLATGGYPRMLPSDSNPRSANICYLRTVDDADALHQRLRPGSRVAVVGGGYLGLEVAAVARQMGAAVTVVETMSRLLARVTSDPISEFILRLHTENGVDVRLNTSVVSVTDNADGTTDLELSSAAHLAADVVLVSIGLIPASELAASAGLETDNGIVVDEYCQTSDPAIFAAGDCTNHPCSENGGRRRLECLSNANEQALVAAAGVLGQSTPYKSIPWFWSEQYDVTLQSVGLRRDDDDVVVRGSPDTGRSLSVFYLRDGQIRAADVLASPKDFGSAKRLVKQRVTVRRSDLEDPEISLKSFLQDPTRRGESSLTPLWPCGSGPDRMLETPSEQSAGSP